MLSLPPLSILKFHLDRNLIDLLLNFRTSCELFHQNTLWNNAWVLNALIFCIKFTFTIYFLFENMKFTFVTLKCQMSLLSSAPKIPVEIFRVSFNYKNAEPFHLIELIKKI